MDIKFPLKLKTNEDGVVELKDEKPVYVDQDGKEVALDAPKLWGDLKAANNESAQRRVKIDELEAEKQEIITKFAGIEDPVKAKEALETIKNLSDKQMIEAGEVERLKQGIKDGYELQIKQAKEAYDKSIQDKDKVISVKDRQIRDQLVRGSFEGSSFLRDKTVLTPDFAYSYFGSHFAIEEKEGKLRTVGMYDGKPIMSLAYPGEIASPEEAIEFLVDRYPQKDRIIKVEGSGGGAFSPKSGGSEDGLSLKDSMYPSMRKNK